MKDGGSCSLKSCKSSILEITSKCSLLIQSPTAWIGNILKQNKVFQFYAPYGVHSFIWWYSFSEFYSKSSACLYRVEPSIWSCPVFEVILYLKDYPIQVWVKNKEPLEGRAELWSGPPTVTAPGHLTQKSYFEGLKLFMYSQQHGQVLIRLRVWLANWSAVKLHPGSQISPG